MNMIFSVSKLKRRVSRKNLQAYREEAFRKTGREQFKKLVERGTDLPVVLL